MIQIDKKLGDIHRDLLATIELVYNVCEFVCSEPCVEVQNAEYGAYLFYANTRLIRFRVAKVTPRKVGQFVTLWRRMEDGTTRPFDGSEEVDYFVISTRDGNKLGQFVFPKEALVQNNIVSNNGSGGKRGIRVYPSWDMPTSRQAQKTQNWQLKYFFEIPINEPIKVERAVTLYSQ
ncbi:MepB family protein [Paenibacillus methanolicus]|uniref:MepB family protein n=1 Tax=Paenibacillus methanolicus TaxID=582686 RepID=UPI001FE98622|nr:MepB family protein [Paenibacillus methanolicus]